MRLLSMVLVSAACSSTSSQVRKASVPLLPVEVPKVESDADFEVAERLLVELHPTHPQRGEVRRVAQAYMLRAANEALENDDPDLAFERFGKSLKLYEAHDMLAEELDDGHRALTTLALKIRGAFAPRGAADEVAVALVVRATFAANEEEAQFAKAELEELLKWTDEVEVLDKSERARSVQVVAILEKAAAKFPAPIVREELASRYLSLHAAIGQVMRHGFQGVEMGRMLGSGHLLFQLGYLLGRLHMRANDPGRALELLGRVAGQPGDDPTLRSLLGQVVRDGAEPRDFVALADHFQSQDPDVAEHICVSTVRDYPGAAGAWACAAGLAGSRGDEALSIARYERAAALEARPEWHQDLARQRLIHLGNLVLTEDLGEARAELDRIEKLHAEAKKRWAKALAPPASRAVFALGRGYYWNGDLERAEPLLARAYESGLEPGAGELLANLRAYRSDVDAAVVVYDKAAAEAQRSLSARLLRRKGDMLFANGRKRQAAEAWRKALKSWDALVKQSDDANTVAEIEIERSRVLYGLGKERRAFSAIDRAIEVSPGRGATYVDAVAFLATRGHLEQALDVYHRAMGLEELDDYHKIYASLWVYDLGRRTERPVVQAQRYLAQVQGSDWHHQVAGFMSGRLTYDQAKEMANTRGKRAEIVFYEAQNRLAAGKLDEARALWQQVLDSRMIAFYEYEMAAYYFRQHNR